MREGAKSEGSVLPNKRGLKETISAILLVGKKKKNSYKIKLMSGGGAQN